MSTKSRNKVVIVSNSITGGGAEISMMRLFRTLEAENQDVALCALNKSEHQEVSMSKIEVIGRNWGSGPIGTINSLIKFRAYLRREKPRTLLVNCELPELYASICAPFATKIFIVEHTSRPWNGRRILGLAVRSLLAVRRVRWFTVSRDTAPIWPYKSIPRYIPNSHVSIIIDSEVQSAEIVFIGRLNQGKHPEVVAEAAKLTESSADFFGDGPMMEFLIGKYATENIQFHGFVDSPWIRVSSRSLVIVASEYEGDGMNIVEAVANRNPLLLMDNPDLRRFNFPDSNYFNSLEDLVEKIKEIKIKGSEHLVIAENRSAQLVNERNPKIVASQWIKEFTFGVHQ
jgi:glycosyltransferase involved in cell wall biosynthesis